METGGYERRVDFAKLGPTLTIAASLILAIRTAKWPSTHLSTSSDVEWEAEVEHAIRTANRVLAHLIAHKPSMFAHKDVPWYVPNDDDSLP